MEPHRACSMGRGEAMLRMSNSARRIAKKAGMSFDEVGGFQTAAAMVYDSRKR